MAKTTFLKKNLNKNNKKSFIKHIKKENSRNIKNTFFTLNLQKKNLLKKEEFSIKKFINPYSQKSIIKSEKSFLDIKLINKKFHFKYSYDFFCKINSSLIYSKNLFNSVFVLGKINLKGFFELNLNLNSIQKVIFKNAVKIKQYFLKKKFFRNFIRNFLKISKKLTYKNFSQLSLSKNIIKRKIALNKNIALLLNKILLKNRQRIFSVLNYGFFFTFLLKSNNITELNKLFISKVIFKKNIFFFKFYNINLFKNYFFRNDFIGMNNRFFFVSNDISHNFSEIFNIIFTNISIQNSYTKLNNINTRVIV